MPTYRNDAQTPVTPPGYCTLQPGAILVTDKYVWPVPVGLTVIANAVAPWTRLHAGALPASITGLIPFGQIVIINNSGAHILVIANGDVDNPLVIPDQYFYPIDQDHEIDTLHISGTGQGDLYVYGLR